MDRFVRFVTKRLKEQIYCSVAAKKPENWPTKVGKYEAAYISMALQPHRKMNNK